MKRTIICLVSATLLIMAGCRKDPGPAATPEPVPPSPDQVMQEVMSQVDECMATTNRAAAIDVVGKAMENPVLKPHRGWLYAIWMDLQVQDGRLADAEKHFFDSIQDAELARAGYDVLAGYYQSQTNQALLIAWAGRVLTSKPQAELAERSFTIVLGDALAGDSFDRMLTLVGENMDRFGGDIGTRLAGITVERLLGINRLDDAGVLIGALEKRPEPVDALRYLVARARLELAMLRGNWTAVEQELSRAMDIIPDANMAPLFDRTLARLRKEGEFKRCDGIIQGILKGADERPAVRRQAAVQWLDVVRDQQQPSVLVERMNGLFDNRLLPRSLFGLADRHFYYIMQEGSKDDLTAMIKQVERLLPLVDEVPLQTTLKGMIVDGSFVTEDYERTLSILEAGIPDRDPKWQAMALNKVRAHVDLKAGRVEEAIARFREFMEFVKTWERAEQDPSTGVLHSKEMTLGRNARRIGDLYAGLKQSDKAAAAYAEARGYYDLALKEALPESPEQKLLAKEIAELPAP